MHSFCGKTDRPGAATQEITPTLIKLTRIQSPDYKLNPDIKK